MQVSIKLTGDSAMLLRNEQIRQLARFPKSQLKAVNPGRILGLVADWFLLQGDELKNSVLCELVLPEAVQPAVTA